MEFWHIIQDFFTLLTAPVLGPFCRIYDYVVMNCLLGWKTTEKKHSKKVAEIQAEVSHFNSKWNSH